MLIPRGPRLYLNDQTGTPARILGAGDMPVNFLGDDGAWAPIDPTWAQRNGRWRVDSGPHRLVVDPSAGIQYSIRDVFGNWQKLGLRPAHLVKLKISNATFSVIQNAATPSMAGAGGFLAGKDVFPGVNLELEYFNDSWSLRWIFTQAARDALQSAGPWPGYMLGTATELDPSQLTAEWRDSAGTFAPDSAGRFHPHWIDAHVNGARVFALARNYLQYDGFDPVATSGDSDTILNGVPVHKLICKRGGKVWLVELFDPILANALPAGDLSHNATFGNTSVEGYTTSVADFCTSLLATPATSGTADSITARTQPIVAAGQTLYAAMALYTDAEPPLGLSAVATVETSYPTDFYLMAWRTWTFASPPLIIGGIGLNIAAWSSKVSTTTKLAMRAGTSGGENNYRSIAYNYSAWADLTSSNAVKLSIYCTYTEAAGGLPAGSLALMGVGK